MNDKEELILSLIRNNPFITQNELATQLQLSRSAIAGYISSLTRKGEIVGRAYVVRKKGNITCIGGANVDVKATLTSSLHMGTSNPVESIRTMGGVARNVAENLGRLGVPVSLFTAVGDDPNGRWLLEGLHGLVDISLSHTIQGATSGTYTALLDEGGEMVLALADMGIYDEINFTDLEKRWSHLTASNYILLDTNLSVEVIESMIQMCSRDHISLCLAPVSSPKAKKIPQDLRGVSILVANRDEIETITNQKVEMPSDFEQATQQLFTRGVETVVITCGKEGVYYYTQSGDYGQLKAPKVEVKDVTGAGDSLTAGILYALNKGMDLKVACQYGMTCSYFTLQSEKTVSPELNEETLQNQFIRLWRS